jgi:tetratricopeptide (TPR) repeat protein
VPRVRLLPLLALLWSSLTSAAAWGDETSTSARLMAGVRAFQGGDYERALAQFRAVARAADAPADLAFYLGPTLYKLARYEEALEVFADAPAPLDPLTELYLAQTRYQLHLYRGARASFQAARAHGLGPRLDGLTGAYLATIDALYAHLPGREVAARYLETGHARLAVGRPVLAAAYLQEALEVARLSGPGADDLARASQIALADAWTAAGRPQAALDLLSNPRDDDEALAVARALVAAGQPARARAILDAVVAHGGPRAADARAQLKLVP